MEADVRDAETVLQTPYERADAADGIPLGGRLFTLKHADMFAVFDGRGDIRGGIERLESRETADGLFQDDTRILSRFLLTIGSAGPRTLSAGLTADNALLTIDMTTPRFRDLAGRVIEPGQLHIRRRRYVWKRAMYEAVVVRNYARESCRLPLVLRFDADFRDVFEVRGARRPQRGRRSIAAAKDHSVTLAYDGLDGGRRCVTLVFSRIPTECGGSRARFDLDLEPGGTAELFIAVHADCVDPPIPDRIAFLAGLRSCKRSLRKCTRRLRRVQTTNEQFNCWLDRATADLSLLITQLETGPYPYAGIPWFSVPFGRDAIVTGFQTLWLDPSLSRGVLDFLAANQATETSAFRDSAPGKIMHETRRGEMARLDEVPFRSYFGGVDSTPLFVMLAGAYYRRTGDVAFLRTLWPNIQRALGWIDAARAEDKTPFLTYHRGADTGLRNQGWKDSDDSVFHADGTLADGPIALVEVQAYVHAAKWEAAAIAEALGHEEDAVRLRAEAETLRQAFEEAFWSDELGTYVLALDGRGRPCRVRASNAGHVLFAGTASPTRAAAVARELGAPRFFSGWGVRTVAAGEARYNPMSYHNGSVWPHDCSLIAAGLGRYGYKETVLRILTGLFDVAQRVEDYRLPELFCGFQRRGGEGPVAYPAACIPQAWASGAPFLLLQACLGLEVDGINGAVRVTDPALPPFLDEVIVSNLPVGTQHVSIRFGRSGDRVETSLLRAGPGVSLVLRTA